MSDATATTPDLSRRAAKAAAAMRLLGDPTRVHALMLIEPGTMAVGEIAAELGVTQPALSHHVALMKYSGIVEGVRDGKANRYRLTGKGRVAMAAIDAVIGEGE